MEEINKEWKQEILFLNLFRMCLCSQFRFVRYEFEMEISQKFVGTNQPTIIAINNKDSD